MIRDSLAAIGLLSVLGVIAVVAIHSSKASRTPRKSTGQQAAVARPDPAKIPSGKNAEDAPAPLDESCDAPVLEKPAEETGLASERDSRKPPPSAPSTLGTLVVQEMLLQLQASEERDPQRRAAIERQIEEVRRERRSSSIPHP